MKKPNEMNISNSTNEIINFLETTSLLNFSLNQTDIEIVQIEDGKCLHFPLQSVDKVLSRTDVDGSAFIQVNFADKTKVLITKSLIGFKPIELVGFDSGKIPKVVTTVDLNSVHKAIEDMLDSEDTYQTATELEVLKKVYQSIMLGAEQVGFEMKAEKVWFTSFLLNTNAATA